MQKKDFYTAKEMILLILAILFVALMYVNKTATQQRSGLAMKKFFITAT